MKMSLIATIFLITIIPGLEGFSVYECQKELSGPSISQCLQTCGNMTEGKQVSINIYPQVVKENFTVHSCQRIIVSQDFTETWTFSQISSEINTKIEIPDETDCRAIIKDKCTSHPCISMDHKIEPEYHYAKTINKQLSYYKIRSILMSGYKPPGDGEAKILIDGQTISASAGTLVRGNSRYVWDTPKTVPTCPWEDPLSVLSCFEGADSVVCPRAGIFMNKLEVLHTNCKIPIFLDKTGIVFSVGSNPPNDYYPAIIQTVDVGLKTAIEGTRYALKIRDQHKCQQECLDLYTKTVQINGNYWKQMGNQWYSCTIRSNCTIDKESYICGDGDLIWTRCNGKEVVASLINPFQKIEPRCFSNRTTGYNIKEVLNILDKYHTNHSEFNIMRSDEIKEIALRGLETTLSGKPFNQNTTQLIKDSPTIFHFPSIFKNIRNYIVNISHTIKVYLIIALAVIILFAVISITISVERRRAGSPIKVIYTALPKDARAEEVIIK